MTTEQIAQLIQSTGLGGLVALLIYKIIVRFGAFCAPQVQTVVNEHRKFLDVTGSAIKVIESTLTVQHGADIRSHEKTHGKLDQHGEKLDEIHGIVKRIPRPPSDSVPRPN